MNILYSVGCQRDSKIVQQLFIIIIWAVILILMTNFVLT